MKYIEIYDFAFYRGWGDNPICYAGFVRNISNGGGVRPKFANILLLDVKNQICIFAFGRRLGTVSLGDHFVIF